jgi:hypothetical protein
MSEDKQVVAVLYPTGWLGRCWAFGTKDHDENEENTMFPHGLVKESDLK